MTGTVPLVSIVIPVFNGANYLGQAITSALAQTWPNLEVIVVDDGSTDDSATRSVIQSFGDRIRAFHQPNGGVAVALNRGIAEAAGDFISWLSHDDLYDPRKVEIQMQRLSAAPGPCIVFGDYDIVDRHGRFLHRCEVGIGYDENVSLWAILESRINGCALLLPRECFDKCGLFDPALPTTQDYDLWFRMVRHYRFVHQAGPLVRQRSHSEQGSLSPRHADEASLLWCHMLDRLDADAMSAAAGTPIRFLLRLRRALRRTGYEGAKARVEAMLDAEIARIPVTLALAVTPALDIHAAAAQVRRQGIRNLTLVLLDISGTSGDSLLLRDPDAGLMGPVYRLPHRVHPAHLLSLARTLADGRYFICLGPTGGEGADGLRAAIESMENDPSLGCVLDGRPAGTAPSAFGPFEGGVVGAAALDDAIRACDGEEKRLAQRLALSARIELMSSVATDRKPEAPAGTGQTEAGRDRADRFPAKAELGRSLLAKSTRWLVLQRGVGTTLLQAAGFLSRYLPHEPARLRLRRSVEVLFRVATFVDANWYWARYPDVAAARLDPVVHYLLAGWRENRDPSAEFSTRAYLEAHPDMAKGHVNPLTHMTVFAKEPPGSFGRPAASGRHGHKGVESVVETAGDLEAAIGALSGDHTPGRPGLLLVLHPYGGGTARYASVLGTFASRFVNVTYALGVEDRYLILSRTAEGTDPVKIDLSSHLPLAVTLLRRLGMARVDILHTIGIEGRIDELLHALAIPYDVTLLDYHLLATQPHLCGSDGHFIGDDKLTSGKAPLLRPEPSPVLRGAARILACSRDLAGRAARIAPAFPPLPVKLPEPHAPERFRVSPRPFSPDDTLHVLMMGMIGPVKGLDILEEVLRLIRSRDLPIFLHLLGKVPIDWPPPSLLDRRLQIHGPYRESELTTLICRIRPHLAWFPFQAPETHSFVLTDALLNGLPILASDIGAIGERLEDRDHTWLLPWHTSPADWVSFLDRLRRERLTPPAIGSRADRLPPLARQFYETEYLRPLLESHGR
ncbi:MAG TPA: glycosyltransferase [Hypericibacter adhaerens]|uniref:glycosyltransferase n=1 Tax=Hypericibacter adhaerens TaxID=2602016 RepID=UPI002CCF39B5|nr:glycosyltransferase [Hypericibacter adhaerens]HWA43197.1 glycosyltransferase [Hypericibacter adhaerens]